MGWEAATEAAISCLELRLFVFAFFCMLCFAVSFYNKIACSVFETRTAVRTAMTELIMKNNVRKLWLTMSRFNTAQHFRVETKMLGEKRKFKVRPMPVSRPGSMPGARHGSRPCSIYWSHPQFAFLPQHFKGRNHNVGGETQIEGETIA